jgi:hypothetical protein
LSTPSFKFVFIPSPFKGDVASLRSRGGEKIVENDVSKALEKFQTHPFERGDVVNRIQFSDRSAAYVEFARLIASDGIEVHKIRCQDSFLNLSARAGLRIIVLLDRVRGLIFPLRTYSKKDKADIEPDDLLESLQEVRQWIEQNFDPEPPKSSKRGKPKK